ncbi:MAG: DUF2202 domain-containing protein [Bacteroidota bacterium]
MKNNRFAPVLALAVFAASFIFFTGCQVDPVQIGQLGVGKQIADDRGPVVPTPACECLNSRYPSGALSAEETAALLFAREEAKMVRDISRLLSERWGTQIFRNLYANGQENFEMTGCLIDKYRLQDPAFATPGVFSNEILQSMYNNLAGQGLNSHNDALRVSALAQEFVLYDLTNRGKQADNTDIRVVFGSMMLDTRNNLRDISQVMSGAGISYTPSYINAGLYHTITSSGHEANPGVCPGN